MFNIKERIFNWIFKDKIDSLNQDEKDLAEIKEALSISDSGFQDNDKDFSNEVDEFGCERESGSTFPISPDNQGQYVVEPNSHSIIPYNIIEDCMRKTGFYKKHNLKENFESRDVTSEILKDFMGFYGGSLSMNNYFEWNFQKQRLMFERSHEECQKGIGKAIKDITTNFVLGDGIGFEYTDIKIEDIKVRETIYSTLWKIWQDSNFDQKQYTISDFAVERGEVFVKISQDKEKVIFDVEVIDPWEITDYVYDPKTRKVKAWIRDYYRNGQPVTNEPLLVEGGIDPFTQCPYTIKHYKFNVSDTIIRGRSDIYSVLYWIKIYNDFLKCRSRVNRFRSSVAWHKQIEGGDRAISKGATKIQRPFPAGSVVVSDAKTTFKAIESKIQAGDVKDDGDSFKIIIASAIQIPHHWLFGSGENTNLATAKNMSAVPKRKFLRRQKDLKGIFQDIFWQGLRFYVDVKHVVPSNGIEMTEELRTNKIKLVEAIAEFETNNSTKRNSTVEDHFFMGQYALKKKHLEISIPNIDEHNSEDLLRLVNAAKGLRAAGIGSNRALYDLVGINYRMDKDILEHEVLSGDYEVLRKVHRIFNNFKNDDGTESVNPELDKNKDGVVDDSEQPNDIPDDPGNPLNKSKGPRGGS